MGGHGGGDKDAAKENFKKKSMFGFVVMATAIGGATFASRHKWTQLVIRETLVNQTAGGAPKYAKTEPVSKSIRKLEFLLCSKFYSLAI